MTKKTLLLELFQPFAQYRNPFTFYYAQTYPLPPKSTIIGMLQNAVGDWYGKKEEYEIENEKGEKERRNRWWELKISIHGGFESVYWNYQQLIKGELAFSEEGIWINNPDTKKKNNWLPLYSEGLTAQRTPIHQQELFNGHLYVFIRGDENLLEEIKKNLQNLKKILYLGRSEDVVFIRKVEFIEPKEKDISVKGDIKLKFPTYISLKPKKEKGKEFPIKQQKFPVYSIPTKVLFKNGDTFVKHKSEITKNTEREVDFATVIYTGFDYTILLKDKIEIERFEITDKLKFNIIKDFGWL